MSEFLAEARVIVRPDTSRFRAELAEQLRTATRASALTVPVTFAAAGGAGVAAAAGATGALVAAQEAAGASALGLTLDENKLTRAFGAQAVILQGLETQTLQTAGVQRAMSDAAKRTGAGLLGVNTAASKLDAGLLGLRTALGSAAVIGLGAVALGAIAAGKALRASVIGFAEFEQQLNTFQVVAGASADQMEAIREQAQALGADVRLPAVSAADAAVALTELAKAGLTVEESLAGVEGVLQLATAAQISNAEASLIAANALNSFGLAGSQAERVADVLANAANAAQGSISDFGLALRQSAAVARQVGLSLEDTTAILSLFAKNGLQGSDAGTSLRVALIRLVAPTKAAAAEIKRLGLEVRDAQGNFRADVFAQFGEATENLSPAMRDAAAALIFGQDAIRAVSIGAREGAAGLKIMQFQIDQQGTAAEIAASRTQGLAGALSALQNAGEGLAVTFGALLSGPLGATAKNFAVVASSIDKLIQSTSKLGPATLDQNSRFDQLSGHLRDIAKTVLVPGEGFKKLAVVLDSSARAAQAADEKFQQLNDQLQLLQSARVATAEGGLFGIADQLTPQIEEVRGQIQALERESQGLSAVANPLRDAVVLLERIRDTRIDLDLPTVDIDRFIRSLERQAAISEQTEGNIQRLRDDFAGLGNSASKAAGGVDALTKALKDLARQSSQAQAELLKLQTEGGTPQEQIAVLQADIAAQFDIIAKQKARGGASGAATAIKEAREQIKSDQAEVKALQDAITSDAEKAASEAERARDERDAQILRQFEAAVTPIERLLARAGTTDPLKDDIKFTEQLIAIYRNQIAQAAKRIRDVQTRNRVLKTLGDALFNALESRKRLAQDERKRIRDALEERIERLQRGTELDIELADINENTKRRIALREKLIAQLKKEAKKLKLTGNALKENRNEIARINAEIEGIKGETKETGKGFNELAFEFLQTQQGFAANLLGNLIPGGATGGLVGNVSTVQQPGFRQLDAGVRQDAAVAAGRDLGFSRGQGNETNQLLRGILAALHALNGRAAHPEARYQRATGGSGMDIL